MTTRGIRNNNPGNIRRGTIAWRGLSPVQGDPDFCQYVQPIYGLRAMSVILRTYVRKHGFDTLGKIAAHWAPTNENDTDAYLRVLCARCGTGPADPLPGHVVIIPAIVYAENGVQPYAAYEIVDAIILGSSHDSESDR
jgi:hypothetical protein